VDARSGHGCLTDEETAAEAEKLVIVIYPVLLSKVTFPMRIS